MWEKQLEYSGRVHGIFNTQQFTYIDLLHQKICFPASANGNYFESNLGFFLNTGDSILKDAGSDTLLVIRDSVRYFFIIGQFVPRDRRLGKFNPAAPSNK
ncbi:MAG: hypothetical protein AAFV80_18960 [Bacteroidota bacterium]